MAPLVIAHRGDSDAHPENTLAAFQAALDAGAQYVELDVQITRDGEVVVIHDPTLDRTTSGRGPLSAIGLADLKRLSAGYPARFAERFRDERVPTLREALDLLRGRAIAMIEIKPESVDARADDGIEARTIEIVRRAGMEKEAALISFHRTALLRCRDQAPAIARGHLFHRGEAGEIVQGGLEVQAEIVLPHKTLLSVDLRDRAREAALKVATWVVDEPDELPSLAHLDLYGIGTNRPAVMMRAVGEGAARPVSRSR
ncbi:MAG TPA: glycerophosphodiester phosphodiesterase family protein [Vicinamibacteria bacterium]|nr:glycerophosphodiester phosphodiesterase family protein [Vicinamibacteria bacterium]